MKDDPIPETDRVSRYCSGGKLTSDKRGVSPTAFYLDGHEFVSINWLEYLKEPSVPAALRTVRIAMHGKDMQLRATGRFAVLNVGATTTEVQRVAHQQLRFVHQPDEAPPDPSHSGLFYPSVELSEHLAGLVAGCVKPEDIFPGVDA